MKQENFTKKELERLGCNDKEIKLVMDYQKKLPIPSDDVKMNARVLHNNLGVGRDFSTWITFRIKKYNFIEYIDYEIHYESSDPKIGDVDFTKFSKNQLSAMRVKKEYYITLTMAKELCIIENNDIGRIARRYFILMEKVVKENKDWRAIRDPEKEEYKKMSAEVDAWYNRIHHRKANRFEFAAEADMLNLIVTGKTSHELKCKLHIVTNNLLRDYLKKEHNEELLFLEQ